MDAVMSGYTDQLAAEKEQTARRFRIALWLAVRLFIASAACGIASPLGFRTNPGTLGNVLVVACIFLLVPAIVAGAYAAYFFYDGDL